ncbi:hypothetical protein HJG60_009786 [Phyllostomus discolor]|uniref:Uncharacterized protein n=1 Tax=Phyllostomus discolor TaxID=89673 RepID=A0A834B880_9CHIR|nr:hypothetical protein HJG60_009786 [Phyllostomus discolor]
MNSPVRLGVSPIATSTPTGVFSQRLRGFISPHWNCGLLSLSRSPVVAPSLSALECGTAQSASLHIAYPGPPVTTLPRVLSAWLLVSTPLSGLAECVFFNSLVVGLPYSSIFCQFWLFFVFKFVAILLLVSEETQCVYINLHLGQKSLMINCSYPRCHSWQINWYQRRDQGSELGQKEA